MIDAVTVAFWVISVLTVTCAIGVVVSRNLFHSAIFLVGAFIGVGGLYLTLSADFLFAVQLLVYAGAVAVLIVFGVMLTQQRGSTNPENNQWVAAALIAACLLGAIGSVLAGGVFPVDTVNPPSPSTEAVAAGLFTQYALPFEVASVLLLVAMVGAIVIAREDR